ncbi:MAG: hypothetical protein CSA62_01470 [Planctomycetota bacterium]|nr:MAG: hypothetical protein CSA62_01470 [Planctomycetota bacterium]
MVSPEGQSVLLDFGLAHMERAEAGELTMTGDHPGTPVYMSPEQIDPRGRMLDTSADLWSLGVCLYEALLGRSPFDGHSLREIQGAVLQEDPPLLWHVDRSIPREFGLVVHKALEKDRTRRYRSAGELHEELERYLRREPVRARRAGPLLRLRRWCQSNPLAASFLLVASLALLSITWLLRDNQQLFEEYELLAWGKRLEDAQRLERELNPVRSERSRLLDAAQCLRLASRARQRLRVVPGPICSLWGECSRYWRGPTQQRQGLCPGDP